MTNEELKKILENHQHWLNEDVDGWEGLRANLEGADLRKANLKGDDLRNANLTRANLRNANLEGADLEGADLTFAYLRGISLRNARLRNANLIYADLAYACLENSYLRDANLECSYLREACLKDTVLRDAYLRNAYLEGADLEGADLEGADLRGADLRKTKNIPFIPMTCPEEGAFIGWKNATFIDNKAVKWVAIIKLYIPEDAKRSSATGRKCRCSKAKVLDIELLATGEKVNTAVSHHDHDFIYKVGEYVEVDNFDEDRFNECAPGIHFFINKQEAIDY